MLQEPRQWCGAQVPAWFSETPVFTTTVWPTVSQKSPLTDHEFTLMVMLVLGRAQKHGGGRKIVEEGGKIILIWPYLGLNCCCFCALMYLHQVLSFLGHHMLSLLLFHFLGEYTHTSAPTSQPHQCFTCYHKWCQNSSLRSKTEKYFTWSLLFYFRLEEGLCVKNIVDFLSKYTTWSIKGITYKPCLALKTSVCFLVS